MRIARLLPALAAVVVTASPGAAAAQEARPEKDDGPPRREESADLAPGPPAIAEPAPARAIDERPPLGLFGTAEDALVDPRMARSWGAAPPRSFAATTVDVGFLYTRPRLSLGYGKPFTSWLGVDLNPIANSGGIGAYAGVRMEIPFFDLRLGSRYWFPFNHSYLAPAASYDRLSLETDLGTRGTLWTHEAELDVALPAGPGNVLVRGSVSYITGVPEGSFVYEPTLRVIVAPPIVWRGRVGYALRLGRYGQHSIGLVGDVLHVPGREDSLTCRVGPILRLVLSRRVDLRGSFVTTVSSPDRIGLAGGDFTELGVRYRWATEP